jgi:hypothetical protein
VKAKTQKPLRPNEGLSLKTLASSKGDSLDAIWTANQGMSQGSSHPFSNLSSSQSSALGGPSISIGDRPFETNSNAQGIQYIRDIKPSAQPPTSHSSQPLPVTKNTILASPQPSVPVQQDGKSTEQAHHTKALSPEKTTVHSLGDLGSMQYAPLKQFQFSGSAGEKEYRELVKSHLLPGWSLSNLEHFDTCDWVMDRNKASGSETMPPLPNKHYRQTQWCLPYSPKEAIRTTRSYKEILLE